MSLAGRLADLLFGPWAGLTAVLSAACAAILFRQIVRDYRRVAGFPWLPSLGFAVAAATCVLALHACLA